MREINALEPKELHEAAKAITKKSDQNSHWSRLAAILFRIERQSLYSQLGVGYGSTRAYAEEELGIGFNEYDELMSLARMMISIRDVDPEIWNAMKKTYALQVRRVLALGGDPRVWVEKAMTASSVEQLRQQIEGWLGKEQWTTYRISMPTDLAAVTEEAMAMAYPAAVGQPLENPEDFKSRANHFRCWLVIVKHFVETYSGTDDA